MRQRVAEQKLREARVAAVTALAAVRGEALGNDSLFGEALGYAGALAGSGAAPADAASLDVPDLGELPAGDVNGAWAHLRATAGGTEVPALGGLLRSEGNGCFANSVLQVALRLPAVSGVMAYRMEVGATPQRASVAAEYVAFDGRCPVRTPFAYGDDGEGGFCCETTSGFPSHCNAGTACCLTAPNDGGGVRQDCQGHAQCQTCPAADGLPYLYGNPSAGWFCCATPASSGSALLSAKATGSLPSLKPYTTAVRMLPSGIA